MPSKIRGDKKMSSITHDLLKGLNNKQQEAVQQTEGPLLIIARAGSGNTRVLPHRIGDLLEAESVAPRNVIAITFTNKAAREMKERVAAVIGLESDGMWVSTFPVMGVRIVRHDNDRIGYNRNFTIMDTSDQLSVIKQVLKDLNIDAKKFDPRAMLGRISAAKNELKTPEVYSEQDANFYERQVAHVYRAYQKILMKNQ